jgi:hypothetical protein
MEVEGAMAMGRRCCIWSVHGSLGRNSSLASDRQGQLVERDRHPPMHRLLDRQLVVPSADVLHERLPGDHGPGTVVPA